MTDRQVRAGMTVVALGLGLLGAMLLFAPQETGGMLFLAMLGDTLAQLFGAALLGFAAMNWVARGSALGGIYGRSVVAGNQAHFVVGALLLVKHGLGNGIHDPGYWVLSGGYATGAVFFVYPTFFRSGPQKP